MRKGQIESIGLVIIVILIVFVAFFAFIFMFYGSDEDRDVYLSAKAYNFANALYWADVGDSNFKGLAIECCLDRSNCGVLESFVSSNLNLVDEKVGFTMKCDTHEVKVGDDCSGVNSNPFRSSEYEMYVTICRK